MVEKEADSNIAEEKDKEADSNIPEEKLVLFSIGFQIGAPLIIALFLSNMIIGLLARSVPQIQIFVVGFPLTLLLGFIFLMLGMPFMVIAFRRLFSMLDNQLLNILRLLGLS